MLKSSVDFLFYFNTELNFEVHESRPRVEILFNFSSFQKAFKF